MGAEPSCLSLHRSRSRPPLCVNSAHLIRMPDNASAPQATLHEIRTAANSAAFLLPALISMKEDSPDVQLLDVGAGSGTISTSFAELLPGGHVIAVDINVKSLARAQALAEKAGIKNIDFRQGSVYELPFADESFDITFCHQVLIHIGNPWDALREMLRVTKRNGIVAAREGDYETESIWPSLPGLTKFHDFMASLMSAGGGSPTAGRELLGWALRAHVSRDMITLSHSTTSYSTAAEKIICCEYAGA